MSHAAQGLNIVGIDRNEAQLEAARERLPEVEFQLVDFALDSMAYKHRFDLMAARYVIHELSDPIATFTSWKDLLAPGGKVLLIETPGSGKTGVGTIGVNVQITCRWPARRPGQRRLTVCKRRTSPLQPAAGCTIRINWKKHARWTASACISLLLKCRSD
jgi:ubiquinone/menaquinone biosynthesis C-methylase UbiE